MGQYTYIQMHNQMKMMKMKKKKNKKKKKTADQVMSMSGSKELLTCRDIIMEILLRLPAKSLLQLRWVCKYWFNLITDPVFVKMHHLHHHHHHHAMIKENPLVLMYSSTLKSDDKNNHHGSLYHTLNCMNNDSNYGDASPIVIKSLFPPPPFNSPQFEFDEGCYFGTSYSDRTKVLTCNGVLCLIAERIESHQQVIILWNPCTNEYKELPQCLTESPRHQDDDDDIYYGFGYDHTTNDYKLIRNSPCIISGDGDDSGRVGTGAIVDVYTLGTNSWKRLGNCPYTFIHAHINPVGVLVNESIYWLGRPPGSRRKSNSSDNVSLVSFDIANEDYSGISTPFVFPLVILDKKHYCATRLLELNGCLHVLNTYTTLNFIELWRMMKDYGVNSWSKLFTFNKFTIPCGLSYRIITCKVLGIQKNGEFLMLVGEINLVLYNPQNGTARILGIISPGYYVRSNATFIESLVSLNSGTYNCQDEAKTGTYSSQDEAKTSSSKWGTSKGAKTSSS